MTMPELLVVIVILGVLAAASAIYLRPLAGGLGNAVDLTQGFLGYARASAIATTSAYRVAPLDNHTLVAETAMNCSSGVWTEDRRMRLELPRRVTFESTAWSVCFSSRGMASGGTTIELQHPDTGARQLQVLVGGTTRIVP